MKMKKHILLFMSMIAAASISSCNYLDQKPDNLRTPDQIWTTKADAEAFLWQVYANVWCPLDDFSNLGASDESSCPIGTVNVRSLIEGNWNPNSGYWAWYWGTSYNAIRQALVFEANIDRVPNDMINGELKAQYKAESMFLRGWFGYQLLRQFGPFVIIEEATSVNDDFSVRTRSPFDDCVEHICGLMKTAMENLPEKRLLQAEYGRPSQAACLAVISNVRLLAASELWNGNPDMADFKNQDGTPLAAAEYSVEKWRAAADAARDLIYLGVHGLYRNSTDPARFDPYLSFRDLFLTNNDEIIFSTNQSGSWQWGHEKRCAPMPGGYSMLNATQNLVDAFYTRNGLDIGDDPAYRETGFASVDDPANWGFAEDGINRGYLRGEHNMYVNREARFYATISYNGRPVLPAPTVGDKDWYSSESNADGRGRAEYYYSGKSGALARNSMDFTGYDNQKMVSPSSNIRLDQSVYRPFIHIRYAEILLNYIEALNECDPASADIVTYLDEIRDRAGIPGIAQTYPSDIGDQQKMREWIIRERQIELAFEADRYWTLCRRKLFEKEEYRTIGRMNVNADDGGQGFGFEGFYTRTSLPTRFWDTNNKMYLFPIPQDEIDKGLGLVQNPGW